ALVALDQQIRMRAYGVEQRFEPGMVALGEVAEHMLRDQFLDARMADPEAYAAVVPVAMGVDGANAVVAACTAAGLDPDLSRRKVELVIEDRQVGRPELVEAHRLADGLAGQVHVGLRLEQDDFVVADLAL